MHAGEPWHEEGGGSVRPASRVAVPTLGLGLGTDHP